jgi:hypothetical protein
MWMERDVVMQGEWYRPVGYLQPFAPLRADSNTSPSDGKGECGWQSKV